ncbi:MAG: twin-arginine translocase subunit TatB [Betaproteobacteria bacterium]|nr:twin-arginine translocase subunit TatB [Betaproteobacteria bacterium]
MFDISFSELLLIGVVALIVIGPERLPKVARTAGHLLGRLQRYVADVKSDINREIQLDELRKLQQEMKQSALDIERSVSSEMRAVESSLREVGDVASSGLSGVPGPLHEALPGAQTGADAAPPAGPAALPSADEPPARAIQPSSEKAG